MVDGGIEVGASKATWVLLVVCVTFITSVKGKLCSQSYNFDRVAKKVFIEKCN